VKKDMLGSLRKTIEYDHHQISSFFNAQPAIYQLLDTMVISARGLLTSTLEDLPEDECSTSRYMLWRTMSDYMETSLLLLLKTRIDEGYALLRMSTELARDIARIGESHGNFEMWKCKDNLHRTEEYKTAFRFDVKDKTEKHLFSIYNLASIYGVHGHQTRDMQLSHIGDVVLGRFIRFKVPECAMLEALNLWLFSFFPLHALAGRTFSDSYANMDHSPLTQFLETEQKLYPILMDFKKNVKRHYPKTT
jgi:hypothetical protein